MNIQKNDGDFSQENQKLLKLNDFFWMTEKFSLPDFNGITLLKQGEFS